MSILKLLDSVTERKFLDTNGILTYPYLTYVNSEGVFENLLNILEQIKIIFILILSLYMAVSHKVLRINVWYSTTRSPIHHSSINHRKWNFLYVNTAWPTMIYLLLLLLTVFFPMTFCTLHVIARPACMFLFIEKDTHWL